MESLKVAWGSVVGSNHRKIWKNNQDALYLVREQDVFVGFVADGCGDTIDSPYSEVGAHIGVRLATNLVIKEVKKLLPGNIKLLGETKFWNRVQDDILAQIRVLALPMGDSLSEVVTKHFLFTLVGVVITKNLTVFVTLGDGAIVINGEYFRIGPYPDNMPMYISYNLIDTKLSLKDPKALKFAVQRIMPTNDIKSFLLGCDGVDDLNNAATKPLPGKTELVGSLSQFWTQDIYFKNPFAGTNRLRLIGEERRFIDWGNQQMIVSPGYLPDDTTFISGIIPR